MTERLTRARVFTLSRLREAWLSTATRAPRPGADGVSVAQVAARPDAYLEALHAALISGEYAPSPAWRTWIPKPSGGERAVIALGVLDRVVEGALLGALRAPVDRELHGSAFAYRQGLGALRATHALLRHRDGGQRWVIRGDVAQCFDSIPHGPLLRSLEPLMAPCVLGTLQVILNRPVLDRGRREMLRSGVPQGSLLAPLLANWYLRPFDTAVTAGGAGLVRYADDFVITTAHAADAGQMLSAAQHALTHLELSLNPSKTRVVSFDDGFDFLGFRFQGGSVRVTPERVQAFQAQLTGLLSPAAPDADALRQANDLIRGWRAYFTVGQVEQDFRALDTWTRATFPHVTSNLTPLIPGVKVPTVTATIGGYAPGRYRRAPAPTAPQPTAAPTTRPATAPPDPRLAALNVAWADQISAAWGASVRPAERAAALLAARAMDATHAGTPLDVSALMIAVKAANRDLNPSGDALRQAAWTHLRTHVQGHADRVGLAQVPLVTALARVASMALIDVNLRDWHAQPVPARTLLDSALRHAIRPGTPLTWSLLLARETQALQGSVQRGSPYTWRTP